MRTKSCIATESIIACSGRVFMVMEVSGKAAVGRAERGTGWGSKTAGTREERKDVNIKGSERTGGEREDARRCLRYYTSLLRRVTESQPFYDRAGKSRRLLHFGAPRSVGWFVLEISDGKSFRGVRCNYRDRGAQISRGGSGRGRVEPVNSLYSRRKQKAYKTRESPAVSLLRPPLRHLILSIHGRRL